MEFASHVSRKEPANGHVSMQYEGTKKSKKHGRKNRTKSKPKEYSQHDLNNFTSKPETKILYLKVLAEFENWIVWQRKILLCGLTKKCTRPFLQTLSTVFEPVLHINLIRSSMSPIRLKNHFKILPEREINVQQGPISPFETDESFSRKAINHKEEIPKFSIPREITNHRSDNEEHFLPLITSPAKNRKTYCTDPSQEEQDCNNNHVHQSASSKSSRRTINFFPNIMTSRTNQLGKICSVRTVVNDGTVNSRYSTKDFKNRKWWTVPSSDAYKLAVPKGKLLMQNFRKSLETTYMWFSKWSDAERGDCILHLISACQLEELKYFSQCILQRLKDITDIDRLQDGLMIKIFNYLSNDELLTASEVCHRWHALASDGSLWKNKCRKLGEENGIFDIISQINGSGDGTEVNWKTAYGDLLSSLKNRNARCEEEHALQEGYQSETDDESKSGSYIESIGNHSHNSDEEESQSLIDDDDGDDDDYAITGSSVSAMSDYLNGDLGMIENTVQQLSAKSNVDRDTDEEAALDIRPETSVQARNQLGADQTYGKSFKFVNVEGIRALKRVRRLQGHLEAVLALQFDKKRVMSGSADRTIRIWDVRSGRSVHKLKGQKGGIRALRFDNTHIITASWDMTIVVWDAVKFKRLKTLHGHQDCVSCLEITEEILVSGSHDKTVKVWCKDSWKCLTTLKGHKGGVTCLALLGNEAVLSGSSDRTIRLWSLESYVCQKVFCGSQDVVLTVQVCGDLLAAGSNDGRMTFWNMQNGQCEASILAHNGPLHAMSIYGTRFVTAGGDQLVKEWDLATCCCLRSFTGHKDVVLCVQASPKRIVSGSADGTVRIWDMESRIRL